MKFLLILLLLPILSSACACLCATKENGGPVCNPNGAAWRERHWENAGGMHK